MKQLAVLLVLSASTASAEPAPEMHENVLVHGMWFPHAGCTKRFGKERTIKKAERATFARCFAKLERQATTRKSANDSAQILTYAPGIEVELGFDKDELYYAGYPHAKPSNVPTITAQAFEGLRKTGSTNVDKLVAAKLDAAAKQGPLAAWIEVCLDAKGAMTATVAEASSPESGAAFLAATADWTFRPFVARKTAMPVCSLSLLTYPAAAAPTTEILPRWWIPDVGEVDGLGVPGGVMGGAVGTWTPGAGYGAPPPPPQNVPPSLLEGLRTSGSITIEPDDVTKTEIVRSGKTKIIGAFKMCLDASGSVSYVAQLKTTGFAAYDSKILREMKTWTYRPFTVNGKSTPACTAVTFIYTP
jgi:hypothetical protein